MSRKLPSSRADSQSPLEQGEGDPQCQQQLGDAKRGVVTAIEAARQQDQENTAHAAEHVGELEQVERQHLQPHFDVAAHGRDHARAEQQTAGGEGADADKGGRNSRTALISPCSRCQRAFCCSIS